MSRSHKQTSGKDHQDSSLPGVTHIRLPESQSDYPRKRSSSVPGTKKTLTQPNTSSNNGDNAEVTGVQYKAKPDVWQDILHVLEQILHRLLCCLTCGCYRAPQGRCSFNLMSFYHILTIYYFVYSRPQFKD